MVTNFLEIPFSKTSLSIFLYLQPEFKGLITLCVVSLAVFIFLALFIFPCVFPCVFKTNMFL